jgi:hypothetical protein
MEKISFLNFVIFKNWENCNFPSTINTSVHQVFNMIFRATGVYSFKFWNNFLQFLQSFHDQKTDQCFFIISSPILQCVLISSMQKGDFFYSDFVCSQTKYIIQILSIYVIIEYIRTHTNTRWYHVVENEILLSFPLKFAVRIC